MTLNREQEAALRALLDARPGAAAAAEPGWLYGLLGLSGEDVRGWVNALLAGKDDLQKRILAGVDANPLEASLEFLGLAALAFYTAEKSANPKVRTLVDAIYFITTCASVGYADVFPVTQAGRAIASLVMTVGPALTSKALDGAR